MGSHRENVENSISTNRFNRTATYQVLLLIVLTSILYGGFLWNPIVFDDANFFFKDNVQKYWEIPFQFDFRWFSYTSLAWSQMYLGPELIYFRLGNLALHISTCIVLLIFLKKIFAAALPAQEDALSTENVSPDWLAFFGALIFALHPVAVYGAGYLIQRSIVMATLFVLLMLICWMKGLEQKKQRWFFLSVGFYFLALFSKEHSIMVPAVLVALTVLLQKPSVDLIKRIALPAAAMGLIALLVVLKAKGVIATSYEPDVASMLNRMADASGELNVADAYQLSVVTQGYLFFKYLLLWLIPNPAWMSIDMREPFAHSIVSMPYLIGFLAFVIYPVLSVWLILQRGRLGLLGFAMLFPWLLFGTEIATVRLQEQFVLYRSYLWAAGIFVALPWLFEHAKRKFAIGILCVFSVVSFGAAWDRLTTLSHAFLVYQDAAELLEGKDNLIGVQRIYYNRGNEYFRARKYDEAIADYTRAITINPEVTYINALHGRGKVYFVLDKLDLAMQDFSLAIKLDNTNFQGYLDRATVLEKVGRYELAIMDYRKSCELAEKACDKVKEMSSRLGGESLH